MGPGLERRILSAGNSYTNPRALEFHPGAGFHRMESRGQSCLRPPPSADRAGAASGSSAQIRDRVISLDETGTFLNFARGVVRADIRIEF